MNFWQSLPTPFLTVAPMADVTDVAFRRMIAKYSKVSAVEPLPQSESSQIPLRATRSAVSSAVGQTHARTHTEEVARTTEAIAQTHNPFVMWTEFVAADGLVRAPEEGKQKLLADMQYDDTERPVVAQLFSSTPAHMEYAAALCRELGFDGVDINMGCPDKSIEKQGCGSAMIKTPERAAEVIAAAQAGARAGSEGGIPVSVKTRLGYYEEDLDGWIASVLRTKPAALSVHCRTRQDMSKVPARWDRLPRIAALRDELSPDTRIVGNGDVLSRSDALDKINTFGVDGAMVGRALFGDPWFFHPTRTLPHNLTGLPTSGVDRETLIAFGGQEDGLEVISINERLEVLVEHTHAFVELLPHKSFNVMKKHYKGYCNGFDGAGALRKALMQTSTPAEVEAIVADFLTTVR